MGSPYNAAPTSGANIVFKTGSGSSPTISSTATTVGAVTYLSGASGIAFAGTAALTVNGGIDNRSSSTQLISAPVVLGAAQTFNARNGNFTLSNSLALGSVANNFTLSIDGSFNTSLNSTISDGGSGASAIVKNGSGVLTLGGNNTYTGTTSVSAGTLRLNHGNALGGTASGVSVSSGATLDANAQTIGSEPISSLAGTGVGGNGALINSNTTTAASWGGNITLASGGASVGGAGSMTITGIVQGNGPFTKVGNGTVAIQSASNYSGNTVISGGNLTINQNDALPTGTRLQISSGAFNLNGKSQTVAALEDGPSASGHVVQNFSGTAGALTVNVTGADASFSGRLGNGTGGDNFSLTKSGSGALTLSGVNGYTGATSMTGGTLKLADFAALGSSAAGTSISSGATLDLFGLPNTNTVAEPITSVSGTGVGGNGAIVNSVVAATSARLSGNVTLAGDASVGGAGDLSLEGVVNTGAFTLTKVGAGKLTLTNNNTASGNISIEGGTLAAGSVGSGGNLGTAQVTIKNGAAFEFTGGTGSNTHTFVIDSTGGAINVSNSGGFLDLNNGSSNRLTGSGALTKSGPGTLHLGAANTGFSGGVSVTGGTLSLGADDALGTGTSPVALSNGSAISYFFYSPTGGFTRGIALGSGGGGIIDTTNQNVTHSGEISGTGALAKYGSGALTLTNTHSYSGPTTVHAGKLLLNGSYTGGGRITVKSGATLGGSGSSNGGVTVESGGTLAPGNSAGTITVAELTLQAGANYQVEIDAPGPDASTVAHDKTVVGGTTGTVTIGGATLQLVGLNSAWFQTVGPTGGAYRGGEVYTIIDNDGADPVSGIFDGLAEGAVIDAADTRFSITYSGGDGNDVQLVTVPEPTGAIGLVGFCAAALARRNRRARPTR